MSLACLGIRLPRSHRGLAWSHPTRSRTTCQGRRRGVEMIRRTRSAKLLVVAAVAAGSLLMGGPAGAAPGGTGWNSAGGDRQNTRYAASEAKISPGTVGGL